MAGNEKPGGQAYPANRHKHVRAAAKPQQSRSKPKPGPWPERLRHRFQVADCGQDTGGANQATDLKQKRNESGAIDEAQSTQHNPSWYQPVCCALFGAEEVMDGEAGLACRIFRLLHNPNSLTVPPAI